MSNTVLVCNYIYFFIKTKINITTLNKYIMIIMLYNSTGFEPG